MLYNAVIWMFIKLRSRLGYKFILYVELTGAQRSTPEEVAGVMFKTIFKFANSGPSNLQEVKVIVFQKEMLPVFIAAMSNTGHGSTSTFMSVVKGISTVELTYNEIQGTGAFSLL